jgi:hypothetical protein
MGFTLEEAKAKATASVLQNSGMQLLKLGSVPYQPNTFVNL